MALAVVPAVPGGWPGPHGRPRAWCRSPRLRAGAHVGWGGVREDVFLLDVPEVHSVRGQVPPVPPSPRRPGQGPRPGPRWPRAPALGPGPRPRAPAPNPELRPRAAGSDPGPRPRAPGPGPPRGSGCPVPGGAVPQTKKPNCKFLSGPPIIVWCNSFLIGGVPAYSGFLQKTILIIHAATAAPRRLGEGACPFR